MKLLKNSLYILFLLGLAITSCSKDETSFQYTELVGLWEFDEKILQGVSIPLDHCEGNTLLNIADSTMTTITYNGPNCEGSESVQSQYFMNAGSLSYKHIPIPGDTSIVELKSITKDQFIIRSKSSDFSTPDVDILLVYKKIKDHHIQ